MNRLLVIVVFLSLFTCAARPTQPKPTEHKTTTVQLFTRSYPEHKLKVKIIPVNKKRISNYFLNDDITDDGMIAFLLRIENQGDSLYHLLKERIVYRNVLREDLRSMDRSTVTRITRHSAAAWYVFTIVGGPIAESRNAAKLRGLSDYLDESIVPPRDTIRGTIVFPFSYKELVDHSQLSGIEYRGPYPIKGSTLVIPLIDKTSRRFSLEIKFDDDHVKKELAHGEKRDKVNIN